MSESVRDLPASPLIHVGYHKTATSWLQETLFPSARDAAVVPRKTLTETLITADALGFDPARARAAIARALATPAGTPILSHEAFLGNPHLGGYLGFHTAGMASRLHATFPEGTVLLVVRNQPDMLVSTYKQYVRAGGTHTFRRYRNPRKRYWLDAGARAALPFPPTKGGVLMSKPQNGPPGRKRPQRGETPGDRVSRSEAVAALMQVGLDRASAERAFDSIVQGEREHGRRTAEPASNTPGAEIPYRSSLGRSVTGVLSVSDAFETARPSCRNARWLFLSGNDR